MTHVINPLVQRAPGRVPRFTISETERTLGVQRNHFREQTSKPIDLPRCYRIRYDCPRCGIFIVSLPDVEPAKEDCLHCGSWVTSDACWGAIRETLPHMTTPTKRRTAKSTDWVGGSNKHRGGPIPHRFLATCLSCGKRFETKLARKDKAKFCSRTCMGDSRRGKTTL